MFILAGTRLCAFETASAAAEPCLVKAAHRDKARRPFWPADNAFIVGPGMRAGEWQ